MSKKKTHDEYVAELAIKNPTVEVVGEYVDAKTKIKHHCLLHDIYWDVLPFNALAGKGCKECMKEKNRNKFVKSHEEYMHQVAEINPYIVVLEKYIDCHTPILHLCTLHNIKWMAYPSNILKGQGCVECGKDKIYEKSRKKHEDYVAQLALKNPTIEVIETYINSQTPILHHCLIHDVYWKLQPNNALRGDGCEICHKERIGISNARTHEQYVKELENINPDIEIIGQYINARTPVLHRCRIDGFVWLAMPCNILFGCGCSQCKESSGERQIRQWLNKNGIQYKYQKSFKNCRDILPLPFDFYLNDYQIAIEYQGEQHYRPIECFGGEMKFKLQQKHDNIKREYCKNNNIKLLEIPYFKNVNEELNNFLFI